MKKTKGCARYRRKKEPTETLKVEDHPVRDETVRTSSRVMYDLNALPASSGSEELSPVKRPLVIDGSIDQQRPAVSGSKEISPAKRPLVIDGSIDQQRKRLRCKIEKVSLEGSTSNGHIKLAPTLKKRSSRQDLTLRQFLPLGNIKKSEYEGEVSSAQQKTNKDSIAESMSETYAVMSCLDCYLHVFVKVLNPKCPRCYKRECLLDIYR